MKKISRALAVAVLLSVFVHTASAQTADDVVEKYLGAIGGRANLGKLKSRHITGTVTVSTPGGDLRGTIEIFNQLPNKSRSLMKLDMSAVGMGQTTIDQRFDGEVGVELDANQGNREITGNRLDNFKNEFFPSPFLNFKDWGATAEFVRKESVGDRETFVLLLRPKAGSVIQCFFDAENYLLVKTIVVVSVPEVGRELQQVTEFLEYRDQDGIKIPFRVKNSNSILSYTIDVTKAEHNMPLDETMFSKPQ